MIQWRWYEENIMQRLITALLSCLVFLFLQVRAYYRTCNGRASCNCAAAVLVGDDVIVVDKCGPERGKNSPVAVQLFLNGQLEAGTRIIQYNGGRKYEVKLQQSFCVFVPGFGVVWSSRLGSSLFFHKMVAGRCSSSWKIVHTNASWQVVYLSALMFSCKSCSCWHECSVAKQFIQLPAWVFWQATEDSDWIALCHTEDCSYECYMARCRSVSINILLQIKSSSYPLKCCVARQNLEVSVNSLLQVT